MRTQLTPINNDNNGASLLYVFDVGYGDNGKGKAVSKVVTDLGEDVIACVKAHGGSNAGHQIILPNGKKITCRMIPSGIGYDVPNQKQVIGPHAVLNLDQFSAELQMVKDNGISTKGKVFVAQQIQLLLPIHQRLDKAKEANLGDTNKIGTTGNGIGPAYEDKTGRRAYLVEPLVNATEAERIAMLRKFFEKHSKTWNSQLSNFGADAYTLDQQEEDIHRLASLVSRIQEDCTFFDYYEWIQDVRNNESYSDKIIVVEGGQGAALCLYNGVSPYVTSSIVSVSGACLNLGIPSLVESDSVLGVYKAYETCVGNRPYPGEYLPGTPEGDFLVEKGHEKGSVTGRRRRVRPACLPIIRLAFMRNPVSCLMLNKMDILDDFAKEFGYYPVIVGYRLKDGSFTEKEPTSPLGYDNIEEAVIEKFSTREEFLQFLQSMGCKITFLGNGPSPKDCVVIDVTGKILD